MAILGGNGVGGAELLTCKAIDAPGHLTDPWCGLPIDPASLRIAGQPLCPDHLSDFVRSEIGTKP